MDDGTTNCRWSKIQMKGILHIRQSLVDAVDSFLQFCGEDAFNFADGRVRKLALQHCVRPLGAWYAESEYEEGAYMRTNVAKAFRCIVLMCGEGEGDGEGKKKRSNDDTSPLFHLLPALANLFTPQNANPTTEWIANAMVEKSKGAEGTKKVYDGEVLRIMFEYLQSCIVGGNAIAVYWLSDVLEGFTAHASDKGKHGISLGGAIVKMVGLKVDKERMVKGGLPHLLRAWINVVGKTGKLTDDIEKCSRKAAEIVFDGTGGGRDGNDRGLIDAAMACDANSHIFAVISSEEVQARVMGICLEM